MQTAELQLLEHQLDTIEDTRSPARVLLGGFGSGKTWTLVLWAIFRSLMNPPNCTVLVVEPTYKQIDKVLLPCFFELFAKLGIGFDINLSKRIITHRGGRQIYMESGENPLTLSGMTVACAGIDEPAMQDEEVDRRVVSRVRDPRATIRQVLYTGTPEGLGWVYEKTKTTPTIIAPTTANWMLPADRVQALRDLYKNDPIGEAMYIKGIPMARSGSIYLAFTDENQRECKNPKGGAIAVGMDFNVGLMVTPIARVIREEIHIFDEVISRNTRTYQHVPKVVEHLKSKGLAKFRRGEFNRPGLYGPDEKMIDSWMDATSTAEKSSSTTTDHEIVRDAGFWPQHSKRNPSVKDRIEAVNYALAHQHLFIDPKGAPFTLNAIRRHEYKRGTSQPMKGRDFGERTDPLDAATDPVGYLSFGLTTLKANDSRKAA
jgi:hypothetical protein